jgi:salicylate hydroxylase
MAHRLRILIVGAGIGGLAAALALLRKGFDVEVIERAPELTEAGAGLHCSPNGSRVLIALGLEDAMARVAVKQSDRSIRLWNTGQSWHFPHHGASSTGRYGAPYLLMHRGDLHAMLVNAVRAAKGDAIHVNATCIDFTQTGRGVELLLKDGSRVRGDALIGADGVKSTVRNNLFGNDNPKFTGRIAWRGLVPINRLPEHLRVHTSTNWIGPNGSITTYPVHMGELMNFVALVNRDDWQVESWTEVGTREECAHDLRGWHEDAQSIIQKIDVPYKWGLFLREPLTCWTVGRTSLLGDACHAMLPYLGQGANMAIEDAMSLARSLEAHDDVDVALKVYEQVRSPRTCRVVEQSWQQGERVNRPDLEDPAAAARYIEAQWSGGTIAQWYDWIFDYDATAAPLSAEPVAT